MSKKFVIVFSLALLTLVGCATDTILPNNSNSTPENINFTPATNLNATNNLNTTVPVKTFFFNEHLEISLLSGWSAEGLASGAVNITSGNYILYINPFISQASGVEGGRFSEIAQGAPGVELVLKSHPAEPCGTEEQITFATDSQSALDRRDMFISADDLESNCNAPTNSQTVWYFSYFTLDSGGYFSPAFAYNSLITAETRQFVITATYGTDNINKLPPKNSTEYKKMIEEITEMVKTLKLK